jgi:hypothetical protein
MKKLKLVLPLMAFIFAIALSFAFTTMEEKPNNDFIHLGGDSWLPIQEVNCAEGNKTCTVQRTEGGPIYNVYDQEDLATLKDSDTTEPIKLY